MKPLPIVLMNLVVVAVALAAYDLLRSGPGPAPGHGAGGDADTAALEDRLSALEAQPRRTRRAGSDAGVLERLAALEAAMGAPPAVAASPDEPDTGPEPDQASPADGAAPSPTKETWADPSPAEIKQFRMLQEAVRREDAVKKNKARVEAALDRLPFGLSDEQRAKIHAAFAAFGPRVNGIWTEAKTAAQQTIAAGGDVDRTDLYTSTMAAIQEEFAATLEGVVPPADAAAVADVLLPARK